VFCISSLSLFCSRQLDTIDAALEAHRGNYGDLWRKLEVKYGKRPPKPEVLKAHRGEL
jgi:hypothetical protein